MNLKFLSVCTVHEMEFLATSRSWDDTALDAETFHVFDGDVRTALTSGFMA